MLSPSYKILRMEKSEPVINLLMSRRGPHPIPFSKRRSKLTSLLHAQIGSPAGWLSDRRSQPKLVFKLMFVIKLPNLDSGEPTLHTLSPYWMPKPLSPRKPQPNLYSMFCSCFVIPPLSCMHRSGVQLAGRPAFATETCF